MKSGCKTGVAGSFGVGGTQTSAFYLLGVSSNSSHHHCFWFVLFLWTKELVNLGVYALQDNLMILVYDLYASRLKIYIWRNHHCGLPLNPFASQWWEAQLLLTYCSVAGARGEKTNQRMSSVTEPCSSWDFVANFLEASLLWYPCAWICVFFLLPWRILAFFVFTGYILRHNMFSWQEEENTRKWLTQIIAMKYLFTLYPVSANKIPINIAVMPKQTFSEMLLEVFRNVDLTDEEMKESDPWTHFSASSIEFAADGNHVEGQFVKSALTEKEFLPHESAELVAFKNSVLEGGWDILAWVIFYFYFLFLLLFTYLLVKTFAWIRKVSLC